MKSAWFLIGLLISGCIPNPESRTDHLKKLNYIALSSAYFEGAEPISITKLSGEALDRQFIRLSVPDAQKKEFANWWMVLGPMQPTGGWKFRDSIKNGQIELCLLGPEPGAVVTMAFQAPMSLIGTADPFPPIFIGNCG
jgi:hypothetical protein